MIENYRKAVLNRQLFLYMIYLQVIFLVVIMFMYYGKHNKRLKVSGLLIV